VLVGDVECARSGEYLIACQVVDDGSVDVQCLEETHNHFGGE
jgi:hypothetical protein